MSELGTIASDLITGAEDVLKTGSTNAASGTPSAIVKVEEIIKALEMGASYDWKGAIAALKAKSFTKIYASVEEVASIIGVFDPAAAIVADDMKLLEPLLPVIVYVVAHNKPLEPDAPGAVAEGNGNVSG